MSPDEVPYLLDLHLFLGHVLILACSHKEPSGAVGVDSMLGWVPQSMVLTRTVAYRTPWSVIGAVELGLRG